jgi:putative component of membrane protein insertase Oxa1/YidC/SpoIIIJ protein YidD
VRALHRVRLYSVHALCLSLQLVLVVFPGSRGYCQCTRDLDLILRARERANHEISPSTAVWGGREQEVALIPSSMIAFYQRFVSPQDVPVCNFVPSCSQFAREAINRYGIVEGTLMASERLQRCHQLGDKHTYAIDDSTGRYIDRVP